MVGALLFPLLFIWRYTKDTPIFMLIWFIVESWLLNVSWLSESNELTNDQTEEVIQFRLFAQKICSLEQNVREQQQRFQLWIYSALWQSSWFKVGLHLTDSKVIMMLYVLNQLTCFSSLTFSKTEVCITALGAPHEAIILVTSSISWLSERLVWIGITFICLILRLFNKYGHSEIPSGVRFLC